MTWSGKTPPPLVEWTRRHPLRSGASRAISTSCPGPGTAACWWPWSTGSVTDRKRRARRRQPSPCSRPITSATLGARFLRCHERLRDTRGVVLSLGLFATGSLTWLGVGNVDGVLVRSGSGAPEQLLVRSGVVGRRLPSLELSRLTVARGDTLILATDGIDQGFAGDPGIAFAAAADGRAHPRRSRQGDR